MSSNKLGARGCQWMCDMLQNNVTLLKIDLSDNGFTDKDTVYLLEAFKVVGACEQSSKLSPLNILLGQTETEIFGYSI